MAKDSPVRIYQLAKEMGISSADLRAKITALGFDWDVSNHMKTLSVEQQQELDAALAKDKGGKKPAAKKTAAKKPAAKKTAAKKPAAKKTAAKKTAAKKAEEATADAATEETVDADAVPKKAPAKKAAAKKPAAKKTAAKKTAAEKADADTDAESTDAKPEPKAEKKSNRRDDKRGRRRDDDGPDPEGFDPVPAATAYLQDVLSGMGLSRARVSGTYDGRRLALNVTGAGVDALIGNRNAGADPSLVDSLQTLTGRAAFGDRSGGKITYIDVDGFRASRVDALAAAAKRIAKFVADTGRSVHLPGANNFDRYAFHSGTGRARGVESNSEGYGVFRMLSVTAKKARREEPAPQADAPTETADATESSDDGESSNKRRRRRSRKADA